MTDWNNYGFAWAWAVYLWANLCMVRVMFGKPALAAVGADIWARVKAATVRGKE
jgi:hypothetical protein